MLAFLAPLVVFGVVVFVHEFGHFLAAKSVGVYTPRFSIGFGPALWRRRRGETEYVVAVFPLGGYVRMASRHDEATAFLEGGSEEAEKKAADDPDFDPDAMIPFGPKPVPEHRWFESKPLWARLYILVAGVTMNFALGFLIAIGLAMHFGKPVIPTLEVGSVRPINGQPLLAAIRAGDVVARINGERVRSWNDAVSRIARSTDSVRIETNRASVIVPLGRAGAPTSEDVALAIDYALPPVVGDLVAGEPGIKAGLLAGDTVLSIDGQPIASWSQMVVIVSRGAGRPIALQVGRKGGRQALSITPRAQAGVDPVTGERAEVGKIGAYPLDISVREPVSVLEAVAIGGRATWFMGTSIVGTVRDLVTRKVSVDQLGGPIAITRASVQAARSGIENLLYLIALLSVNVAVLNLLPIPILDGGQILINVLESTRGTPFSLRTKEYILRGGLMFILALFVLVMFNDARAWLR
jgi:regulator of sigma E protease